MAQVDGKKRTWSQWQQLKKKEDEVAEVREERSKAGKCPICSSGKFTLRLENRQMIRTCKDCSDQLVV